MAAALVRITVANTTIRLFANRRDAINEANLLTKGLQEQHNAVHVKHEANGVLNGAGWLVENAPKKTLRDHNGTLSPEVVSELTLRR